MEKVKEYKVVQGIGMDDIANEVNNAIKDNWQPLGGISTVLNTDQETNRTLVIFIQAMVR